MAHLDYYQVFTSDQKEYHNSSVKPFSFVVSNNQLKIKFNKLLTNVTWEEKIAFIYNLAYTFINEIKRTSKKQISKKKLKV